MATGEAVYGVKKRRASSSSSVVGVGSVGCVYFFPPSLLSLPGMGTGMKGQGRYEDNTEAGSTIRYRRQKKV